MYTAIRARPTTVARSVSPLARWSDTQYGLARAQKAFRNPVVCMRHLRGDANQFTELSSGVNNRGNVFGSGFPLRPHARAPLEPPVRLPARLRRHRAVDDPDRVQVPGALSERGAGGAERLRPR